MTHLLEYGIHNFSLNSFSFSSASLPNSRSSSLGPKLPAPASTSCDLDASINSNDSREDDEDSVGEESSEGCADSESVSRVGAGFSLVDADEVASERRGRFECLAMNLAMSSK